MSEQPQHYNNAQIDDMSDVRRALDGVGINEDNWLFVGTSGIHGSYTKLSEYPEQDHFTVLIVRPRTVSNLYGEVTVDHEDVKWLSKRVRETLEVINKTQGRNV